MKLPDLLWSEVEQCGWKYQSWLQVVYQVHFVLLEKVPFSKQKFPRDCVLILNTYSVPVMVQKPRIAEIQ